MPTSNEYIAENIVKGSYAVQHYYRQAINSIPTSIPYRLAIKKGKSQTDISNNAPVPYNCDVVVIDWYWQTWENGILVSEEYLFSTRELDCEGSSGGGYSTDSTKNPCDSVNKLALNAEFRAKLDSLKLRAEATSNKREVGYYYTNTTANSFDETMSIGETDELSVEMYIPDGNKIDGIVHNHFFAEGRSESIFSMGDMQKLIEVYSKGQMNNPYTFSMTLVTQHGDRYMLKINDLSEFSSWATKYNNQELLKTMMLIYHTVPDKSGENYRAFNELNFLKFLDKSNAGLKFFKANTTNNTWQPFKRSGETVIADPC